MLKASSVLGNSQRLDGGAMFGNAPRALWSRWAAPDAAGANRTRLSCAVGRRRFSSHPVRDGHRYVLRAGATRTLWRGGDRARLAPIAGRNWARAIARSTWSCSVICTSTTRAACWRRFAPEPHQNYCFARHDSWSARRRSNAPSDRTYAIRASYIPELPELLRRSGRLHLVDSESDWSQVLGSRVLSQRTLGHTPGMIHARVIGERARLFFAADLVPGRAWVAFTITMGYDRFPSS